MNNKELEELNMKIESNMVLIAGFDNSILDDSIKNTEAAYAYRNAIKTNKASDIVFALEQAKKLPNDNIYKRPLMIVLNGLVKKNEINVDSMNDVSNVSDESSTNDAIDEEKFEDNVSEEVVKNQNTDSNKDSNNSKKDSNDKKEEDKKVERIFSDESRIDSKYSYLTVDNAKNLKHYNVEEIYIKNNTKEEQKKFRPIKLIKDASINLKNKAVIFYNNLKESLSTSYESFDSYLERNITDKNSEFADQMIQDMENGIRDTDGQLITDDHTEENEHGFDRAA